MPIYEYQCPDCGHQFEQLQKISEEPIRICPSCEAGHVKKLVSQTSFVLKGGGWYKDHYGLKSGGGEGKSESKSDGAGTSGGGDKGGGDNGGGEKTAAPAPSAPASTPAATSESAPASKPVKAPSASAA